MVLLRRSPTRQAVGMELGGVVAALHDVSEVSRAQHKALSRIPSATERTGIRRVTLPLLAVLLLLILAQAAGAYSKPLSTVATGHSYPSWPMPKTWQPPKAWLREALCIHRHESVDWHRRWTNWQGRPSPYAGGMQLDRKSVV